MDIIDRFWQNGQINTQYLTSSFLEHATALDLFTVFTKASKDHGLQLQKMIQISIAGTNVNKKFLKDISSFLSDNEDDPKLLDIGTCILHKVHGAFKTACKETQWNIDKFLRALYYLFIITFSKTLQLVAVTTLVVQNIQFYQ